MLLRRAPLFLLLALSLLLLVAGPQLLDSPGPVAAQIADDDGDGIPNEVDQCPQVAGPRSNHGCPPLLLLPVTLVVPDDLANPEQEPQQPSDSDGDGVPDNEDDCPRQHHNGAIFNGCPDSDGDGLVDNIDLCPTVAGPPELPSQGCPGQTQPEQPQPPVISPQPPAVPTQPLAAIPADDGGVCLIATQTGYPAVNVRADASTSAAIISVLNPTQLYVAVGVKPDEDGQLWYVLEASFNDQTGHVASWVVRSSASCATLGEPVAPIDDLTGALGNCPEVVADARNLPIPFLNWALAQPDPCAPTMDLLQDLVFGPVSVSDEMDPVVLDTMIDTCPDVLLDTAFKLSLLKHYVPTEYLSALNNVNGGGCEAAQLIDGAAIIDVLLPPEVAGCSFEMPEEPPTMTGDLCVQASVDFLNGGAAPGTAGLYMIVRNRAWVPHNWYQNCILGQGAGHWNETLLAADALGETINLPGGSPGHVDGQRLVPLDGSHNPVLEVIPLTSSTDIVATGGSAGFVDAASCGGISVGALPPDLLATLLAISPTPPILVANPTDTDTPTPTPFGLVGPITDTPTPTPFGLVGPTTDTPTPTPTPFGLVGPTTDTPTPTPTDDVVTDTPTPTPTDDGVTDTPTPSPTPTDDGATDTPTPVIIGITDTPTPDELTPEATVESTETPEPPALKPVSGFDARMAVFEVEADAPTPDTDLYLLIADDIIPLLTDGAVRETNPAVDSRGMQVAYIETDVEGRSSLYLLDMPTRQRRELLPSTDTLIVLPYDPAWMPATQRDTVLLVTLLDTATNQAGVYSLNIDPNASPAPELLVPDATSPTVASHGRYIAYLRGGQVFTLAMGTGRERAVTTPDQFSECQTPAFDADALRLYLVCTDETALTSLFRYDTGGLNVVAQLPGSALNPAPGPIEKFLMADDGAAIWFGSSDGQLSPLIEFDDARRARNASMPALSEFGTLF